MSLFSFHLVQITTQDFKKFFWGQLGELLFVRITQILDILTVPRSKPMSESFLGPEESVLHVM